MNKQTNRQKWIENLNLSSRYVSRIYSIYLLELIDIWSNWNRKKNNSTMMIENDFISISFQLQKITLFFLFCINQFFSFFFIKPPLNWIWFLDWSFLPFLSISRLIDVSMCVCVWYTFFWSVVSYKSRDRSRHKKTNWMNEWMNDTPSHFFTNFFLYLPPSFSTLPI